MSVRPDADKLARMAAHEENVSAAAIAATEVALPEAAGRPGWTGARLARVVAGAVLALLSLALLTGAGFGLWADLTQRSAGYVTAGARNFSTSGSALATEPTQLGSAGVGWLYTPGLLDTIRVHITPASPGKPLFVGIGRSSDVDRYLAGVDHTVVSDFFGNKTETVGGGRSVSSPGSQTFWVASSAGSGARTLLWHPRDGSWTVVAMNADGRPGVAVTAALGARMPALLWIALGFLVGGAIFLAGGGLLIVGAIRSRSATHEPEGSSDADR